MWSCEATGCASRRAFEQPAELLFVATFLMSKLQYQPCSQSVLKEVASQRPIDPIAAIATSPETFGSAVYRSPETLDTSLG